MTGLLAIGLFFGPVPAREPATRPGSRAPAFDRQGMGVVTAYFSHASMAERVGPGSMVGPIPVAGSPDSARPIGVAFEVDQLGPWIDDVFIGPAEAVWELTIGGSPVPGRFVLRRGAFIDLGSGSLG